MGCPPDEDPFSRTNSKEHCIQNTVSVLIQTDKKGKNLRFVVNTSISCKIHCNFTGTLENFKAIHYKKHVHQNVLFTSLSINL